MLVAWLLGENLLGLIGGAAYREGAAILIPLAVAASFELASVAFEPVLHSSDAAGRSLLARLIGIVVTATLVLFPVVSGAVGIAWAVAMGSGSAYFVLAFLVIRRMKKMR